MLYKVICAYMLQLSRQAYISSSFHENRYFFRLNYDYTLKINILFLYMICHVYVNFREKMFKNEEVNKKIQKVKFFLHLLYMKMLLWRRYLHCPPLITTEIYLTAEKNSILEQNIWKWTKILLTFVKLVVQNQAVRWHYPLNIVS